jgi:hypothetical protein
VLLENRVWEARAGIFPRPPLPHQAARPVRSYACRPVATTLAQSGTACSSIGLPRSLRAYRTLPCGSTSGGKRRRTSRAHAPGTTIQKILLPRNPGQEDFAREMSARLYPEDMFSIHLWRVPAASSTKSTAPKCGDPNRRRDHSPAGTDHDREPSVAVPQ